MKKHDWQLRDTAQFRANTPIPFAFSGGGFVHEVLIELTGNIVFSGGASSGAANGQYNPGNLIAKFDVDSIAKQNSPYPDGKLKSLYTRSVLARNTFDEGGQENGTALVGGVGTEAVSQFYILRFALPDAAVPAETALNMDAYASVILTITTGQASDILTGNDRAVDYSGLTIRVYDRREAASPKYQDVAVLYESDVPVNIAAANTDLTVKNELSTSEAYFDVMLITESGAGRTLVDTVLKQVIVSTQNDQWAKWYAAALKRITRSFLFDKAASTTGLYMVNVAQDGLLAGSIKPLEFKLDVLNPGGANLDRVLFSSRRVVLPSEYMPTKK